MKNFAQTLMYKSYKEQRNQLNETFDHLSFNFSDLYSILYKEMKRREIESNDQNRISNWLNSSHSYAKLHEALILVKNNNIIAKEVYLERLKHMMSLTIKNGIDIDGALKICCLIKKSPHLTSIYNELKCLIEQVSQLNHNKQHTYMKLQPIKSLSQNNLKQVHTDPFKSLNIQFNQLQLHTPVCPTMLQPTNSKSSYEISNFKLDYNTHDGNRCSTFDFPQSFFSLTITDQHMDGAFSKWLHHLKLHKYEWFFNGLTYLEIECIDEDNIDEFIARVNLNAITKGAKKKICVSTKKLRDRKQKLDDLKMALDLEVSPNEMYEFLIYMREILHYPIPNKYCVVGDQLQQDIFCVLEKLFNQLLEKLSSTKYLVAQSLIGTSINKFLECAMLITSNQVFMKHQVEETLIFAKKLKFNVCKMPRNFN